MEKKQMDLFKAETTWFHVFVSMVENGDVAKLGPYAVTVYLVIKAYTNWKTGKAFPSIDTIAEKSGISQAQVKRSLALLVDNGYLDKAKVGRKNSYTLREKVTLKDHEGRPAACATWDYLGVDSEFGKNRTFTKNKWKHYRLFLNSRAAHYGFEKAEHITVCFFEINFALPCLNFLFLRRPLVGLFCRLFKLTH